MQAMHQAAVRVIIQGSYVSQSWLCVSNFWSSPGGGVERRLSLPPLGATLSKLRGGVRENRRESRRGQGAA